MTCYSRPGCLVLAAVTVLWPAPWARRQRRRRLVPSGPALRPTASPGRRGGTGLRVPRPSTGVAGALRSVVVVTNPGVAVWARGSWGRRAVVTAVYGILAARAVRASGGEPRPCPAPGRVLDTLSGAAADLRAGLPAERVASGLTGVDHPAAAGDPLLARVRAVEPLAERTGAPLADLWSGSRPMPAPATGHGPPSPSQAAGSRTTACLLAALPVAGLGLGYAIGADPLTVCSHADRRGLRPGRRRPATGGSGVDPADHPARGGDPAHDRRWRWAVWWRPPWWWRCRGGAGRRGGWRSWPRTVALPRRAPGRARAARGAAGDGLWPVATRCR